ncbi:hypothetical protein PGT21_027012 [Puccinia graminis f. sp. tritici]|uniref:ubiquitinyl hydrolase 1 n=1 Tax=Puccinia graminis f. sp. tritici TaxID=56615 RepID=A0A5B0ND96_PUCGR|nr:hypothetical protein PGT21_027012 [Puccinia graminis f. sp. tritici]
MSLLRWMGVNSSGSQSNQNLNSNEAQNDQWWTGSDEKYFGMENFGNTCYANSVLQALYFCKPFRQLLELSSADSHFLLQANQQTAINQSTSSSPQSPNQQHTHILKTHTSSGLSSSSDNLKTHSRNHTRSKSTSLGLDTLQKNHLNQQQQQPTSSSSTSPTTRPRSKSNNQLHLSKDLSSSSSSSAASSSSNSKPDQQLQHPNIHLKTDSNTLRLTQNLPSAHSKTPIPTSTSTNASHTKRNWGAADFDQGSLGRIQHTNHNQQNPTSSHLEPETDQDPTICSSLRDLFRHISTQPNSVGAVAPQAFITTLKRYNELFRSTMHQDAHEFLNYLVNSVAEDVFAEQEKKRLEDERSSLLEPTPPSLQNLTNPSTPSSKKGHPRSTWVHRLFEGTLTNETKCLTCETVTQRDESFLDLSINIHQNTSLTACLRQFSASEMLCQKNKFSCDQCCSLQEAEKRMKIKKLPNVLALHLKRFKYQENLQRYTKLTYRVVFPFELKLFNTTDDIQDPDRLYELWAIVVHIGAGPHHGHYVTILKSHGQWLLFDDNIVTRIEERDIQKYYGDTPGVGSGYVLFYQATDLDLMDLMGVPAEPEEAEEDSEVGTDDSDDPIPAIDDSTQGSLFTARSSPLSAEIKKELPQLSSWNGFQSSSVDNPIRKNSAPFSSGLSSSSSSNSHPLPSTSQLQATAGSSSISNRTLSTNDRSELPTSNHSNKPEFSTPPSSQMEDNNPQTSAKVQSPQTKISGTGVLSRSPSTSTNPESGLLSPFQTGPSLPKNVLPNAPVRTIPNLPSPKTNDESSSRSAMAAFLPTSPLTAPSSNGNSSKPTSASTTPNLHRKFSAKFLRRKKSSASSSSPVQPPPKTADPSPRSSPTVGGNESVGGLGSRSSEQALRNPSVHHYHQPILSSPLGPDSTDKQPHHQQQHFFSPRTTNLGSYRHSLSTALDHPIPGTSSNAPTSLPPSNRNSIHSVFHSISHSSAFIGSSPHLSSSPIPSASGTTTITTSTTTTKGAQAPPATSILTEKQQREIKKASEKANKLAAKNKLKALKDRSNSKFISTTTPFDKDHSTTNSSSSNRLAAQFKFSRTLSPVESHTNNRSHPPLEPPSLSPHYKGIISPTNVTNQERQIITSPSSSASRKSFGSVVGTQAPPPSTASSHYLHHSLPKLGRPHSASLRSSLTHTPNPNPNPVSLPHSLPTSNPNQNSNLNSNVKANRISASLANRPSSAKRPSIIGPALAPTHKPAAGSLTDFFMGRKSSSASS